MFKILVENSDKIVMPTGFMLVLTYLRGLFLVLFIFTLCGAWALQSVELQRSLGDAAVRDSTLESTT